MAYVHLYKGNPTAGGTDGQLISEGDNSNPLISGPLNGASGQESDPVKLAIRCEAGYKGANEGAIGNTYISASGANYQKWNLALDNNGSPGTWLGWGTALSFTTDLLTAANKCFWIKAKATAGENPSSDTTVKLAISTQISPI